ncbi:hypothetical protein BLNAU_12107 [Blattamonas nauphoetae]|uniref:Uncharacterized protein n=1 Tax=Blattamonas nauphoetae TaxID=2049346 RepID=A0ABQ9XRB6_9EUKA|nr:hypothetical protein BLNAU_12107 [Blattamonas nauphoetae]
MSPLIAFNSLWALYNVLERDPPVLTLLPSPIFPSSAPHQQYFGLSFLAALTKKLRIVFSEFQTNLPTDHSHLPKYIQLTKDDQFIVIRSLNFCSDSFFITSDLLIATPPIEIDSEIIQDLILFVKEALTPILANISAIDTLIESLPSESSPTTPLVSGVDKQMIDSLKRLRNECEEFVSHGWFFYTNVAFRITDPHKSSFQTIILDDQSFPDLILNSLKLPHKDIRLHIIMSVGNIVVEFEWIKEKWMNANLVGRMFETVDFVSLPLSESNTLFQLTKFITNMFLPIGDDEEAKFKQYRHFRVSVFELAKHFITFIFNNSDKLKLNDEDRTQFEIVLCCTHDHITNMELRSDEHDADFVSELVKWEMRTMVEMENERPFTYFFRNLFHRTCEWNRDKRERQKRRQALLREEGWDDAFELRVVGIEEDTNQIIHDSVKTFRIELGFNADEL